MKYTNGKMICLLFLFIGFVVWHAKTMEEIQAPEEELVQVIEPSQMVSPLTELAVKPSVEAILRFAPTVQTVFQAVSVFPVEIRVPLVYELIQDARYPGAALDKLHLAYQASKDAGNPQRVHLDALFDYVMQFIDPCDFVHKKLSALLPGYDQNIFEFRDARLIKAILRKPSLTLPAKYLKQPVLAFKFQLSDKTNLMLSPDGTKLAWGAEDNTLCVWDIQENKPIALWQSPAPLEFNPSIAWSPDSRVLAVGSTDGTVHLWRIDLMEPPLVRLRVAGLASSFMQDLGQPIALQDKQYEERFKVQAEKLSERDKNFLRGLSADALVNVQQDNIVHIFTNEPEKNNQVTWFLVRRVNVPSRINFIADNTPLVSVSFSPDGNFLTTVSEGRRVRVWVLGATIQQQFEHAFEQDIHPEAAVLSAQGTRLALAPVDEKIVLFDNGIAMPEVTIPTDSWGDGYIGLGATALALSPDGNYLAYTYNGKYYLYDINKKQNIISFVRGHVSPTQVFSPGASFEGDGGFVSCVAGDEHPLVVYGMRSNGNLKVEFAHHDDPASFSVDGKYFATREFDRFHVWRLPTDYLLGNITWQQLRDELARMCMQIMPVKVLKK